MRNIDDIRWLGSYKEGCVDSRVRVTQHSAVYDWNYCCPTITAMVSIEILEKNEKDKEN